MQSFVVPLSSCAVLYLFYSPGGGSITPKQGGIHPSTELMDLRVHQWKGCLECGCVELWKVLPRVGARQRLLLGQAVWGHWWERKPNLVAELNFLSSC